MTQREGPVALAQLVYHNKLEEFNTLSELYDSFIFCWPVHSLPMPPVVDTASVDPLLFVPGGISYEARLVQTTYFCG